MSYHFTFDLPDAVYKLQEGSELDLSPHKDGGIMKKLIKSGEGNFWPNFNDKVCLSYTAYRGEIAPEYIFESSERDGKNFKFRLGRGKVIRGFELAIMSMRQGEHAIIHLKPEYAYGRGGAPPKIPENTDVIFDVTILEVTGEDLSPDKDKSIVKHVLKRGKGSSIPNDGCMINIHLKGWHDDRLFDDRDLSFPFGEGIAQEYKVPRFVEEILRRFKMGETSELTFKSQHAYGEAGCSDFDIPPDADLCYEITMNDFERVKDVWEMDNAEKMDQCDQYKKKGTFYYQRDEYKLAKKFYKKMIENIEYDTCMKGEEEERRLKIFVTGYLNLALVYLKLFNYAKVRKCCDKVLQQELNIKALFRRGQASYHMNCFKEAKEDFEGVLDLEPTNKAAKNQILLCNQQLKWTDGQDRQLAKRMLSNIGKGKDSDLRYGSGMQNIDNWDNRMAQGMMSIEQECEAFGDPVPRTGGNNHGIGHED